MQEWIRQFSCIKNVNNAGKQLLLTFLFFVTVKVLENEKATIDIAPLPGYGLWYRKGSTGRPAIPVAKVCRQLH
jgi:hypothetical protein